MTPTQQSGPPSNEQLTQFLMIARGLNREVAGQEVAADPDTITVQYQKVKQLIEGGGQGSPQPASSGTPHGRRAE